MADAARKVTDPKITQQRQQNFAEQLKATERAIERRKELWEALNKFIHQQGGWVVSRPGLRDVRIQITRGSALPTKLSELGYRVSQCGTGTRIQTGKFLPVDIIEISLREGERWR